MHDLRVYRKSCGFRVGDSYSPGNEAEWEKKIARGDYDLRCQPRGDPIEDETEIKRITDALRRAYPPRSQDNEPKASPGPENEEEMEKRVAGMYGFDIEAERRGRPVFGMRSGAGGRPEWLKKKKWLTRNLW
jgi:hypothetical protein